MNRWLRLSGLARRYIDQAFGDDPNTLKNIGRVLFDAALRYDLEKPDQPFDGGALEQGSTSTTSATRPINEKAGTNFDRAGQVSRTLALRGRYGGSAMATRIR